MLREDITLVGAVALVLISDDRGFALRLLKRSTPRFIFLTPRVPIAREDLEQLAQESDQS